MNIIGIDCAAQDKNTGLALAVYDSKTQVASVVATTRGNKGGSIANIVVGWLRDCDGSALLALDAPLGWPSPMAETLSAHMAGEPIDIDADRFFSRLTDQQVWHDVLKKPMDVGADRITRTALRALQLLGEFRKESGQSIPLGWEWSQVSQVCAIEVYPAGTLKALDLHDVTEQGDDRLSQPDRGKIKRVRALSKLNSLRLDNGGILDRKASTNWMRQYAWRRLWTSLRDVVCHRLRSR